MIDALRAVLVVVASGPRRAVRGRHRPRAPSEGKALAAGGWTQSGAQEAASAAGYPPGARPTSPRRSYAHRTHLFLAHGAGGLARLGRGRTQHGLAL